MKDNKYNEFSFKNKDIDRIGVVQDTIKKPTWQQMTQPQKSAKKAELIKKGGFGDFQKYKDSVSVDADTRANADFAAGASKHKMTVAEYRVFLKKNKNLKDQPCGEKNDPNFKSTEC